MLMTLTVRALVTTIHVQLVAATVDPGLRLGPLRACVMTIVTASTHIVMNEEEAMIEDFVNDHTPLHVAVDIHLLPIETIDHLVAHPVVTANQRFCPSTRAWLA